ncbi:MAG: hypothetical protein ACTSUO_09150 [Candidatus Thorarchaeota archaeon]
MPKINKVKQYGNRHYSAGITAREANTILGSAEKIYKISQKDNLFIGFENSLVQAVIQLYKVLEESGRIGEDSTPENLKLDNKK